MLDALRSRCQLPCIREVWVVQVERLPPGIPATRSCAHGEHENTESERPFSRYLIVWLAYLLLGDFVFPEFA